MAKGGGGGFDVCSGPYTVSADVAAENHADVKIKKGGVLESQFRSTRVEGLGLHFEHCSNFLFHQQTPTFPVFRHPRVDMQRLTAFFPSILLKSITTPRRIDEANEKTEKAFNYPALGPSRGTKLNS